jgi:hypothetical protein
MYANDESRMILHAWLNVLICWSGSLLCLLNIYLLKTK